MANALSLREGEKRIVGNFLARSVNLRRRTQDRARKCTPVVTKHGFRSADNPQMASGACEPTETVIVRSLPPHFEQFMNVGTKIDYYCGRASQLGRLAVVAALRTT